MAAFASRVSDRRLTLKQMKGLERLREPTVP